MKLGVCVSVLSHVLLKHKICGRLVYASILASLFLPGAEMEWQFHSISFRFFSECFAFGDAGYGFPVYLQSILFYVLIGYFARFLHRSFLFLHFLRIGFQWHLPIRTPRIRSHRRSFHFHCWFQCWFLGSFVLGFLLQTSVTRFSLPVVSPGIETTSISILMMGNRIFGRRLVIVS